MSETQTYRIGYEDTAVRYRMYRNSDTWVSMVETLAQDYPDKPIRVEVRIPASIHSKNNRGKYIVSKFCTAMAQEIRKTISRDSEANS